QGYVTAPHQAMAQLMRARADAKAHGDVLRLLDRYLAYLRSPAQVAQRVRARNTPSPYYGTQAYQIYLAKTPRYTQIDYPTPGASLAYGAILLLRNAFELFRRDDLLSDLVAHVGKPAGAGAKEDAAAALDARLGLSALRWWADEKDEAVRE